MPLKNFNSFRLFGPYHNVRALLYPAEIIDLLKGLIMAACVYAMTYIDTSMMYHIIKSQSVIKLYLFYNMLEVIRSICLKHSIRR